jgi:Tfp pilus assembly protein PilE
MDTRDMERSDYLINLIVIIIIIIITTIIIVIILYDHIKVAFAFPIEVMDLLCEFFNIQYMYQSTAITATHKCKSTATSGPNSCKSTVSTGTRLFNPHNYRSTASSNPQQLLAHSSCQFTASTVLAHSS